jgi:hypothetical protein
VNFNAGQQARLGTYMAIFGNEEHALLGGTERIAGAERHGRRRLAHRGRPHTRRACPASAAQRLRRTAAALDARHARLKELKQ